MVDPRARPPGSGSRGGDDARPRVPAASISSRRAGPARPARVDHYPGSPGRQLIADARRSRSMSPLRAPRSRGSNSAPRGPGCTRSPGLRHGTGSAWRARSSSSAASAHVSESVDARGSSPPCRRRGDHLQRERPSAISSLACADIGRPRSGRRPIDDQAREAPALPRVAARPTPTSGSSRPRVHPRALASASDGPTTAISDR